MRNHHPHAPDSRRCSPRLMRVDRVLRRRPSRRGRKTVSKAAKATDASPKSNCDQLHQLPGAARQVSGRGRRAAEGRSRRCRRHAKRAEIERSGNELKNKIESDRPHQRAEEVAAYNEAVQARDKQIDAFQTSRDRFQRPGRFQTRHARRVRPELCQPALLRRRRDRHQKGQVNAEPGVNNAREASRAARVSPRGGGAVAP